MNRLIPVWAVLVGGATHASAAPAPTLPVPAPVAAPGTSSCEFNGTSLTVGTAGENGKSTSLLAGLHDPPRVRVTLSVDNAAGFHKELTWDPAVSDGLQHDLLLPSGEYRLSAFAEDERSATTTFVVTTSLRFDVYTPPNTKKGNPPSKTKIDLRGTRTFIKDTGTTRITDTPEEQQHPVLKISCGSGQVEMSALRLDTKRLYGVAVARGLLDQTAPKVVQDTLTLLAEIAIEKAKAGALDLVRKRFVKPLCEELTLGLLGMAAPSAVVASSSEPAFPRVCGMLLTMRLEDLLSSGRTLVEGARDDVRLTLVPRLIDRVNMPEIARGIARVAMQVANEMIDGGASHSAEIDLVVTQLDRIFASTSAAIIPDVNRRFIEQLSMETRTEVLKRALDMILPKDPGEWLSKIVGRAKDTADAKLLAMDRVPACKRKDETATTFYEADRVGCITGVLDQLADSSDWVTPLTATGRINAATLIAVANATAKSGERHFLAWLQEQIRNPGSAVSQLIDQLPAVVPEALEAACAIRVAIGVVKWCSSKDSCTAGDIATALDDPRTIFLKSTTGVDRLCWYGDQLRLPSDRGPYIELASRALGFLTPPNKGDERKRAEAVLRWMFDLAKQVEGATPGKASALEALQEVFALVETHDYVRAISQALLLANRISPSCTGASCEIPPSMTKALNLLGSVASYVQVYDETKALDAKEAKAARKKALESLIDSSTDRSERDGHWVFSFGSPVGAAFGARWTPGTSTNAYASSRFRDAYAMESAFAWRVPLVLAFQRLPKERPVGFHVALVFADLGNFARGAAEGERDKIAWRDFLQLGAQVGMMLGDSKHSILVAGELGWTPGIYERDVPIQGAHSMPDSKQLSGGLFLGFTLAYYVPFLDLN